MRQTLNWGFQHRANCPRAQKQGFLNIGTVCQQWWLKTRCCDYYWLIKQPLLPLRSHCLGVDDLWIQALWWNPCEWDLDCPGERRAPPTATHLHHRRLHDHGQVWVASGTLGSLRHCITAYRQAHSSAPSQGALPEALTCCAEHCELMSHWALWADVFKQTSRVRIPQKLLYQILFSLSCSVKHLPHILKPVTRETVFKCLPVNSHMRLVESTLLLWLKTFR